MFFNKSQNNTKISCKTTSPDTERTSLPEPLLANRTALIIGAGPNIGLHIAQEMLLHGAAVHCTDIDVRWAKELERQLSLQDPRCRVFISDISDTQQTDLLLADLSQQGIRVDVLLLTVGLENSIKAPFPSYNPAAMHQTFANNLFGPLYPTKGITENMIAGMISGSIIFTTFIHQCALYKHSLAYSTSKFTIGMVVREMAMDLAPYGIRVNGIAPGYVTGKEQGLSPLPCITGLCIRYSLEEQLLCWPRTTFQDTPRVTP